ncbi:hypothetical protein JW960_04405 [candidate division KSB1 bacterium]|nr:hypothetical protein [candidate division KSB1 bacterium]
MPFEMVPTEDIACDGMIVYDDKHELVQLPAPASINMRFAETRAELTDDGELICQSVLRYEGYRGVDIRNEISDSDKDEFVKELLEDQFAEVAIDSFKIENLDDPNVPLTIVVSYHIINHVQDAGDMLYLSSALLHGLSSNPFKREKRTFPVEYEYLRASTEQITLKLPAGMQVVELPRPASITSNYIKYMNTCSQSGNIVTIGRSHIILKDFVPVDEYTQLRTYYDQIVSADQAQIVLSRVE